MAGGGGGSGGTRHRMAVAARVWGGSRHPAATTMAFHSLHSRLVEFMASEESKDLLKSMDGKTVGKATTGSTVSVTKKRPKKIRQIPDCYFLPRRSLPSTIAIYSAVCAAGVGAGMLLEVWIKKKIKEDGGIIWQMDK